jgi:L-aspartate oxidase
MTTAIDTDVLIIGSGIGGCIPALLLAEKGYDVTVVTRSPNPLESNTYYAQGGIIYKGENDSPEALVGDIMRAGAGMSLRKSAELLATLGPSLVESLLIEKYPVPFNRDASGNLQCTLEGGHSLPRIVHADDTTGKAIQETLITIVSGHPRIRLVRNTTAIDLLTLSHHSKDRLSVYKPETCVGAYLFDRTSGTVMRCVARHPVLAPGGVGDIYSRSTNPPGSRGDGIAMAARTEARIINAEYIQFHPTTFYREKAPSFLISEAVRGAGAQLVHANGEPFMHRYAPDWKDLAPRDVVARSILKEMLDKDLSHVYLDLRSHLPADEIHTRFPNIHRHCMQYGVDITTDLIPVVPAAHYACGGVWTDEWGCTTVRGLYAVGEVACTGVHGANRLASTSLLEGLVWGQRAAEHIIEHGAGRVQSIGEFSRDDIPEWQDTGTELPDPALVQQDMNVIRNIMWNYVGLVRTTRRLGRALRELRHLHTEIENFYQISKINDNLIGLRNAVETAVIIAHAAWKNKTSVGCHYRE